MKKKVIAYDKNRNQTEKDISYIPFRYILAILITAAETIAVVAIVIALMYYIPYFSIAVLLTQIFVLLQIVNSNDNPDYKNTMASGFISIFACRSDLNNFVACSLLSGKCLTEGIFLHIACPCYKSVSFFKNCLNLSIF